MKSFRSLLSLATSFISWPQFHTWSYFLITSCTSWQWGGKWTWWICICALSRRDSLMTARGSSGSFWHLGEHREISASLTTGFSVMAVGGKGNRSFSDGRDLEAPKLSKYLSFKTFCEPVISFFFFFLLRILSLPPSFPPSRLPSLKYVEPIWVLEIFIPGLLWWFSR